MNTVPLLVFMYPLLYPWLILCDLCPGFQDDAFLPRLSLHSVACSTRAAAMSIVKMSGYKQVA